MSLCITALMQIGVYALSDVQNRVWNENKHLYQSANEQNLSWVGVAISTGIGIRFDTEQYNQATFYGKTGEIGQTNLESREIRKEMIAKNMVIIKEYLALLKTDVLWLLDSSDTRRNTLGTLISQLEIRYKNAAESSINLSNQKGLLLSDISQINSDIQTLKTKMWGDFSRSDSLASVEDVDEYIELRRRYTNNFTDIVYINQFLIQYNFLNNYNKSLLDTLINNKEAIITKSFIVIPDSGDEFLKSFKLLYEESEFKSLSK